jgi:hypothetical protein
MEAFLGLVSPDTFNSRGPLSEPTTAIPRRLREGQSAPQPTFEHYDPGVRAGSPRPEEIFSRVCTISLLDDPLEVILVRASREQPMKSRLAMIGTALHFSALLMGLFLIPPDPSLSPSTTVS